MSGVRLRVWRNVHKINGAENALGNIKRLATLALTLWRHLPELGLGARKKSFTNGSRHCSMVAGGTAGGRQAKGSSSSSRGSGMECYDMVCPFPFVFALLLATCGAFIKNSFAHITHTHTGIHIHGHTHTRDLAAWQT